MFGSAVPHFTWDVGRVWVSEYPRSCTAYPVLSASALSHGSQRTQRQHLLVPTAEETTGLFQPLLIHSLHTFSTSQARVLTTRLLYSCPPGDNLFYNEFFSKMAWTPSKKVISNAWWSWDDHLQLQEIWLFSLCAKLLVLLRPGPSRGGGPCSVYTVNCCHGAIVHCC